MVEIKNSSTEQCRSIPKLRFPEFIEVWEEKKLGNFVSNKTDKYNPAKEVNKEKCIELEHIKSESGQLLGYSNSLNLNSIKNRFSKNDVLFGKLRPYLRKYLLAPFDGVCTTEIWVLKGINTDNRYLFQLIQGSQFLGLTDIASGSKMPRADWNIVSSGRFKIPSLSEQQKIANFLIAIDDKIEQLTKKKSLLEKYKKGIMQQIFSQELRFAKKDGSNYPDWEEKRLGEIAIKSSSNISANSIEENQGEFKIYGAAGLLKHIDFHREKEPYISIVKDGAGVGRTLLCEAFSSVLGTLDIIKSKVDANLYFIYSIINNINFTKYITGSTIPHIYFKDYSKEKIKLPCLQEQTKIANFLSAIDAKIDLVNTQLENTQQFKKGLLQQMFV